MGQTPSATWNYGLGKEGIDTPKYELDALNQSSDLRNQSSEAVVRYQQAVSIWTLKNVEKGFFWMAFLIIALVMVIIGVILNVVESNWWYAVLWGLGAILFIVSFVMLTWSIRRVPFFTPTPTAAEMQLFRRIKFTNPQGVQQEIFEPVTPPVTVSTGGGGAAAAPAAPESTQQGGAYYDAAQYPQQQQQAGYPDYGYAAMPYAGGQQMYDPVTGQPLMMMMATPGSGLSNAGVAAPAAANVATTAGTAGTSSGAK